MSVRVWTHLISCALHRLCTLHSPRPSPFSLFIFNAYLPPPSHANPCQPTHTRTLPHNPSTNTQAPNTRLRQCLTFVCDTCVCVCDADVCVCADCLHPVYHFASLVLFSLSSWWASCAPCRLQSWRCVKAPPTSSRVTRRRTLPVSHPPPLLVVVTAQTHAHRDAPKTPEPEDSIEDHICGCCCAAEWRALRHARQGRTLVNACTRTLARLAALPSHPLITRDVVWKLAAVRHQTLPPPSLAALPSAPLTHFLLNAVF